DILTLKELKAQKFGMLLSVAQGSANEPRVAVMKWMGNPKKKSFDLGLVGKGVTFDSGGISLKPGAGMGDMKQDMTGAAVVTATLRAAAHRQVKSNVIGIVGLVENMPSGTATRPGDIVTSLSGQTVEILNTDAEGRLVLGDCLWYMQQTYGVTKIIDVATLTGATMRALGDEYAGLFSNDEAFAQTLTEAGLASGEKVWRLPMNEAYDKLIDSPVADMKNIGGSNAGGSTAACFLGRFIKPKTVWAHLDIAGVDKEEKGQPLCPKGATGWGVRLLNRLI
ncbi:MAG: leucyl aminopeptidase family protein, partial [Alphaproteobacteria bacterium]